MIPYMRVLWSVICIHVFMLFMIFKNSDRKSPKYRTTISRAQFGNIETYPGWLEQPLTGTDFDGPKPNRAIEVLLYI